MLVLYSLLLVNQGVAVTDTGYNYGIFVNHDSLDNMWKFSTYLATATGSFFTRHPFGNTVLGLNIYTGLVKAFVAFIVYYRSKDTRLEFSMLNFASISTTIWINTIESMQNSVNSSSHL